ncbi:hypothetical protein BJ875DRAFT_529139 [Amylocarpus encephaloides]|uniref:Uncharacterized protein n=1 Tax=Amylocarpus encephaloides TaxID=45428 RepID=A0A9P7YKV5_9HELO|nr:hypothetical protein BJ875DRAFT_529139 [Amylocarpus encephaloides]
MPAPSQVHCLHLLFLFESDPIRCIAIRYSAIANHCPQLTGHLSIDRSSTTSIVIQTRAISPKELGSDLPMALFLEFCGVGYLDLGTIGHLATCATNPYIDLVEAYTLALLYHCSALQNEISGAVSAINSLRGPPTRQELYEICSNQFVLEDWRLQRWVEEVIYRGNLARLRRDILGWGLHI